MPSTKRVLIALALAALGGAGCKKSVGEMQTVDVVGDAPGDPSRPATVRVEMQVGELRVTPGGGHVVSGAAKTNASDLAPVVTQAAEKLTVTQGKPGEDASKWGSALVADWRLTLGSTPLNLSLATGAANVNLELGGLAVKEVNVRSASGPVRIGWSAPNLLAADRLDVESASGDVKVTELGRFGARNVRVHAAAGALHVAFGPTVEREVSLDLEATAGDVTVIVPADATVRAEVKTAAGTVRGAAFQREGEAFILGPAVPNPRVVARIRTAAGNVTLETGS